jgi:hypothetical protein
MGIPETSVIFTFSAEGAPGWRQVRGVGVRCGIDALDGEIESDVFTAKAECLDVVEPPVVLRARITCYRELMFIVLVSGCC